jgi:hypothetical protein
MDTVGEDWTAKRQREIPILSTVPAPFEAEGDTIRRMTATAAVRYAVQRSGHDDYEVADKLGISPGYMSKVMKGTAGLHGARLVKFMRITNSIAPLQWLAEQMGCEVVVRDRRAAERLPCSRAWPSWSRPRDRPRRHQGRGPELRRPV